MNEDEIKRLKGRVAYEAYIASLPKCDDCKNCIRVRDRKQKKRLCGLRRTMIDNRVNTCPSWCPKRK